MAYKLHKFEAREKNLRLSCIFFVSFWFFFICFFQFWTRSRTFFSHNSLPELSLVKNCMCAKFSIAIYKTVLPLMKHTIKTHVNSKFKAQKYFGYRAEISREICLKYIFSWCSLNLSMRFIQRLVNEMIGNNWIEKENAIQTDSQFNCLNAICLNFINWTKFERRF